MATGIANGLTSSLQRLEQYAGHLRRVPVSLWRKLAIGVLSLWLTYSLAQLFWVLMPEPDIPEPPLTLPANTTFASRTDSPAGGVDIAALRDLALFGDGSDVGEAQVVQQPSGIEQEAVDTSLNLKLVGTVASSEEPLAKAFIADGGEQEGFSPGEELTLGPRGVTLAKVMTDRVILNNNGRYETLWLYDGEGPGAGNSRSPGASSNRRQTSSRSSQSPSRPNRLQSRDTQRDIEQARDFVGSVLPTNGQKAPTADQLKTINELINVSMHREGGQFIGFKINPKRNPELFSQLGLEPNDVVTAVNNVGLDDTRRAMEVYRSLSTSSQATLEIMRDGVTTTVNIDLEQYQ